MWVDWFEKKEVVDEEMMIGIVVGTMSMVNHPLYFKWALAAAKQGDADGQTYAGDCYERGCGVEPNDATAFEWYMKAAEQDDGEAFLFLLSPPNLFRCHRLVLFLSQTPKQIYFNPIHILRKLRIARPPSISILIQSINELSPAAPI